MVNSESRASACATSIAALFMSANAPRFDAVAANAILGFTDVSEKPSFFFTAPARNPPTLCCCQSVARIISSMLAPTGWLSSVSTRSCLVTRPTLGSSAFNGVLALAAADVTLRRDVAFDLALPFLGVARAGKPPIAGFHSLRAEPAGACPRFVSNRRRRSNKGKWWMMDDIAKTGVAAQELTQFVERVERLEEEKKAISEDIRDVYAEMKGCGFDVRAVRQIVRIRKQNHSERKEMEAILELYMSALNMN